MQRVLLALWTAHRRQPAQALLMLLGLALSIAVVVAIDLSIASARNAFADSQRALSGGATHRVEADGAPIPEQLLARLAVLPGVRAAAPVIEVGAIHAASGQRLLLLAIDPVAESAFRDWSAALLGDAGGDLLPRVLGVADALVLPRPLAERIGAVPGTLLRLRTAVGEHSLRVAAVVDAERLPSAAADSGLMDIAAGQALPGFAAAFSRIDLVLEDVPGGPAGEAVASTIAALLPAGLVLTATVERDAALAAMSGAFEVNLQALGLLAMLVGVFLVYQTLAFLGLRRRGLIGLLRALGVRGRELVVLLLGEAALLGMLAAVLGSIAGIVLAQLMLDGIARTYADLYGHAGAAALAVPPALLAKAALLAIGGALVSALLPLRETLRAPPLSNLHRVAMERSRGRRASRTALPAALVLVLGLALLRFGPRELLHAFAAIFLMLAASLGLVPLLAHGLLRALESTGPRWPVLARWLLASARLSMSRLGIALAALTLAMATLIGMSTMIHSFRSAVADWVERSLQADVFVTAGSQALLSAELAAELSAIEGVRALSLTRRRQLLATHGPLTVTGMALPAAGRDGYQLLAGDPAKAWADFALGDALASEPLANRLGLAVGDALVIPAREGDRAVRIAGIYRDYSSSQGVLTLSRERYLSLFDDPAVNAVGVYLDDDRGRAVIAQLRSLFADQPGIEVVTASEVRERSMEVFQRTFAITDLLRLLAAMIAIVAVVGALLAMQLERAREFALLRAIGLSQAQMARLQWLQAGLVGLLAGLLAVPVGLALALALVEVINTRSFGWSMPLLLPWGQIAGAVLIAVASAALAGWLPARRLRRVSLAKAMRELPL